MYSKPSPPDEAPEYAGLGIRAIAFAMDLAFVAFLIGILEVIIYGEVFPAFGLFQLSWQLTLLYFSVLTFYFSLSESSPSQASIGKMVMGLKVVGANGERLGFFTAAFRYWLTIVSTVSLGLGFIPALLDKQKASWHDRLTSSFVVKAKRDNDPDELF